MPYYHYACDDCKTVAVKKLKRDLTSEEYDVKVLFETSHAMKPSDKELKEAKTCPRCSGCNCERSYKYSEITGYVRGNGYLDKQGVKRDMNLHHLTQNDPYAEYRQPGEVEDMKTKLVRGGRHNPNRRHYDVSSPAVEPGNKEVAKSVKSDKKDVK